VSFDSGSNPFGLSLSKPCLFLSPRLFDESRCRSVAAAGDSLSFASPKESKPRKGDPGACVPSLRCGQPAVLAPSGVELELAALRQSLALIRLKLRSSAHSQGFFGTGSESDSETGFYRVFATIFIAACARITWARGLKHYINRRAAWFWGPDRNFAAKHPQGAPKARQIWALTPKTSESASASASFPEFNPQTPCGRAEQRRLGQIKILDVRRLRSRLVSKISAPAEQRKEPRRGPDFGSPFFSLGFFGEAKKSRSPAAATERHRNPSTNLRPDLKQGFDRLNPNGFPKIPKSPTPC
jgi:hypothetical protein